MFQKPFGLDPASGQLSACASSGLLTASVVPVLTVPWLCKRTPRRLGRTFHFTQFVQNIGVAYDVLE